MATTASDSGDELIAQILAAQEGESLETKRLGDQEKKLRTISAFANTSGGTLVLGVEDSAKASEWDRVVGLQDGAETVGQLQALLRSRITPPLAPPHVPEPIFDEVPCTLHDGTKGSIVLVRVQPSSAVHSIVEGGTYARFGRTTRQLSAEQIVELAMRRGVRSWTSELVDAPLELLETQSWREYSQRRGLTRPIGEALFHVGLARRSDEGELVPTRAAVLLFAEEPSGILDSKCAIRIFQYKGDRIERGTAPNLLRPPRTISGPLIEQIRRARDAVVEALATGVQVGPLGFEIIQSYPLRVIQEAITNAVIHRDYRFAADIKIRIFSNRITIESPGGFPGSVTPATIGRVGSRPRNRAIVDHLREFPSPPNLDAGEGVPMMVATMDRSRLYPPVFVVSPLADREEVRVLLFNEKRPGLWPQVHGYLQKHAEIGNAEVRALLRSDDSVRASKLLKSWVERGLLEAVDATSAKQKRRYRLPGQRGTGELFSTVPGKHGRSDR